VMAAIRCLHHYDIYLENEWRERVYIHVLNEVIAKTPFAEMFRGLYRAWELQRPYRRSHAAKPYHSFADYRKEKFDLYLKEATKNLTYELRTEWAKRISEAEETDLPAYKKQMSILAYLETGKYGEERVPISLQDAHIGIIYKGHYYLIPVCRTGTTHAPEMQEVRSQIMAILTHQTDAPHAHLNILASIKRSALFQIRERLNPVLKEGLNRLRYAPILLNFAARAVDLPLAEIRQAERGCGDHALTVFDTGRSFVFDQSHIFFDGEWGAAFAEIMTNQALSMAVKLHKMGMPQPSDNMPHFIHLPFEVEETAALRQQPQVTPEASAENHQLHIRSVRVLRHILKNRNDFLALFTVNDLMLLYRAIHAARYVPNQRLIAELQAMQQEAATSTAAAMALEALESDHHTNPTMLIPVNAMLRSPRDRVCPVSFEVPVSHLNFLELYEQVTTQKQPSQTLHRDYLTALAAIAEILHRIKHVAAQGESSSAEVIKLLAHMPASLQRWLDKVPNHFDVLNDLIKGREVFSNVGAVVPSSTLRRFTTAKDDNDKKTLCWGVITDAEGKLHLSLRDFRPHVAALRAVGRKDMADRMAQDYLDSYAQGFKQFVRDLREITLGQLLSVQQQESSPDPDMGYTILVDEKYCDKVTEWVSAETLENVLACYTEQGDFMPVSEALRIGKAIAAALEYAPTPHGTLTPTHIQLARTGQILVTGFGVTETQNKLADVKKLADIMYQLLT
ncbi:MAG: choline/carnitine O-acyltransferase, partial [Anaerolineae bacterium]|nr:choline/carnitine O-acyltransferase [Anaerolineae bacterium]